MVHFDNKYIFQIPFIWTPRYFVLINSTTWVKVAGPSSTSTFQHVYLLRLPTVYSTTPIVVF